MSEFKFKKRYGQNFLRNENIAKSIANSIKPKENDLILEIGPGSGAITKLLKLHNAKLVAFEIDEDTKKYLLPLENEKTKIVYQDFLKTDLNGFLKDYNYENLYIIGNLPYYITTPILEHIIESKVEIEELVIMVQKEVADRFLARPHTKEYGYMSVILNYNFELARVVEVDRKYFYPVPKVDSTVIKLKNRKKEKIDYDKFKNLLKQAFQFKRKNLSNNLKNYNLLEIEKILEKYGYNLQARAEELNLEVFIDLIENAKI